VPLRVGVAAPRVDDDDAGLAQRASGSAASPIFMPSTSSRFWKKAVPSPSFPTWQPQQLT
jgi:hypothetical protein